MRRLPSVVELDASTNRLVSDDNAHWTGDPDKIIAAARRVLYLNMRLWQLTIGTAFKHESRERTSPMRAAY